MGLHFIKKSVPETMGCSVLLQVHKYEIINASVITNFVLTQEYVPHINLEFFNNFFRPLYYYIQ